jgi:hypothetical protein
VSLCELCPYSDLPFPSNFHKRIERQGPHRITRTVFLTVSNIVLALYFAEKQATATLGCFATEAESNRDNYVQKTLISKLLDVGICPEHASTGSGCEG